MNTKIKTNQKVTSTFLKNIIRPAREKKKKRKKNLKKIMENAWIEKSS